MSWSYSRAANAYTSRRSCSCDVGRDWRESETVRPNVRIVMSCFYSEIRIGQASLRGPPRYSPSHEQDGRGSDMLLKNVSLGRCRPTGVPHLTENAPL